MHCFKCYFKSRIELEIFVVKLDRDAVVHWNIFIPIKEYQFKIYPSRKDSIITHLPIFLFLKIYKVRLRLHTSRPFLRSTNITPHIFRYLGNFLDSNFQDVDRIYLFTFIWLLAGWVFDCEYWFWCRCWCIFCLTFSVCL